MKNYDTLTYEKCSNIKHFQRKKNVTYNSSLDEHLYEFVKEYFIVLECDATSVETWTRYSLVARGERKF